MATDRCEGRLVRNDPKGVWMLPLEGAGNYWFHIPIRCEKRTIHDGLCELCLARARRTEERVKEAGDNLIKRGLHPGLLHGRIGDPVPVWSRLMGGTWYNLKIQAGCRVSDETMGKAKMAVEIAEGVGATLVAAEGGGGRRGRKPKADAEVEAEAAVQAPVKAAAAVQTKLSIAQLRKAAVEAKAADTATEAKAVVETRPPAPPAVEPKQRRPKQVAAKPAAVAAATLPPTATGFVEDTRASPVDDVVEITVRRLELDGGRSYYLDPKKQKVYDMKCKYVGRYSADTREIDRSFPDSDAEAV